MMKSTRRNCELIFSIVLSQLEDENGRGEFDAETGILNAVEKVIEWIEDDKNIPYDK